MTVQQFVDRVLRTYMHEKGLDIQWNQLSAICRATIGSTPPGAGSTIGAFDLNNSAHIAATVNDQLGKAFTPLQQTPDPGADRNREKYPQLGNERF